MQNINNNYISIFIDELIQKAGISELPNNYLKSHKTELQRITTNRITLIIMENLSNEDAEIFQQKFVYTKQTNTPEAQYFFSNKIPELDKKIETGLNELSQEYLKAFSNETS